MQPFANGQASATPGNSGWLAAAAVSGGSTAHALDALHVHSNRRDQLEPPMRLYSGFHWKRGRQPSLLRR